MSEPKTTKAQESVAAMHAAYNKVTKAEARPWIYDRFWFELHRHGYNAVDIEVFCLWVLHENSQREQQYRRRFHIPRMFGDLAEFDADLSLARAWYHNRRPAPTPREKALQQLRPVVDPEMEKARLRPAQSAGEVLRRILQRPQSSQS